MPGNKMKLYHTVFLLAGLVLDSYYAFPKNEYEYSVDRDWILQKEKAFSTNKLDLTNDEKIVNQYLSYLKWKEFEDTKPTPLPSRPIEETLQQILNSDLFKALKPIPKGGNMHIHDNHVVSKRKLLDIAFKSDDYEHLYIGPEGSSNAWNLNFFINKPDDKDWVKVKGSIYTIDKILPHLTLIDVMDEKATKYPTDSDQRWQQMGPLWGRAGSDLINNVKVKEAYQEAMMQSALDEGVQYLETRRSLRGKLYQLNTSAEHSATNGHQLLDLLDGEVELNKTMREVDRFIKSHSDFIGLKTIIYTTRSKDHARIQRELDRVLRFHKKFPKWIVGFDLVAEEDKGNSHLFFLENLLTLYNNATQRKKIDLFLHTSETSFTDEQRMSDNPLDPVSALQNTYDAIVLGANRVGHGLGYFKHPYLMSLLKERKIAVELCPVSNQILGFVPDLRNHPGQNFIRYGIPCVMGSDDPATFGYDHFTVDWYMAYMGWGIDLADWKRMAMNSLEYSAMDKQEKDGAMQKFNKLWDKYITETKASVCGMDLTSTPEFARILPREGAKTVATKVYVFGSKMQLGICEDVKCKFGDKVSSKTTFVSNQLIICDAPANANGDKDVTVGLQVSFDGGATYQSTKQNFTYKHEQYEHPEPSPQPCSVGGAPVNVISHFLIAVISILSCIRINF